jgi:hypothetical protein
MCQNRGPGKSGTGGICVKTSQGWETWGPDPFFGTDPDTHGMSFHWDPF